jgi:hypothetical protein
MRKKTETITLTRRQAKALMKEIASVAEAAYRRGVQQAGMFQLSPGQAAEYRYYGKKSCRSGFGSVFTKAHAVGLKSFQKTTNLSCVDQMEWSSNVDGKGPFRELANFAE